MVVEKFPVWGATDQLPVHAIVCARAIGTMPPRHAVATNRQRARRTVSIFTLQSPWIRTASQRKRRAWMESTSTQQCVLKKLQFSRVPVNQRHIVGRQSAKRQ